MTSCDELNDKAARNAGIAGALEELIENNRAQSVELEMLANLVKAEIGAAQQREAATAACLEESQRELANALATVEIEKARRIEAEEFLAEMSTAVTELKSVLARFPSAASLPSCKMKRGGVVADQVADVEFRPSEPALTSADAATGDDPSEPSAVLAGGCSTRPADMAEPKTVRIVVKLSLAQAMALETSMAQAGKHDTVEFATDLICQGLRRLGPPPVMEADRPQRE